MMINVTCQSLQINGFLEISTNDTISKQSRIQVPPHADGRYAPETVLRSRVVDQASDFKQRRSPDIQFIAFGTLLCLSVYHHTPPPIFQACLLAFQY